METAQFQIKEVWVNETKGYQVGNSGWYEPYTDNLKDLFRALQKKYGKCMSRVYVDAPDGRPDPIGWVFWKRVKYSDCKETYIQGTWVTCRKVKIGE